MRSPRVRLVLLAFLLAAGALVAAVVGLPSVEAIRSWADGAGWAGPLLFAGLYASLSLVPAPLSALSIAAGVLFGLATGLAAVLVGAVAGAVAAFEVARVLGRPAMVRVSGARAARLDDLLRRRGLLAVIGVRLVPLLPFTALNYACGLTAVSRRDYALGTAVGIVPGAAAYVAIGAYGADPGSAPFLLAVGGLAALSVGGIVVARRRRRSARS